MDYRSFVAPYLNNIKIEETAEIFRKEFWNNKVPVQIEEIIELKLNISIVPIPGFLKLTNMDALITSNFKDIYVDNSEYIDGHRYKRLRFSLAHEIGHLIMHKKVYESFGIKNLDDYHKLYKDISREQYGYLESQANKFASYLLIPRKILAIEMERELKNKYDPRLKKIDRLMLNSYLAKPLSKIFEVSEEAANIAINDINS